MILGIRTTYVALASAEIQMQVQNSSEAERLPRDCIARRVLPNSSALAL